MSLPAF
jgi:hypothetical protein